MGRYRRANVVYWGVNAFLILTSVFGLINVQPSRVTSFLPFGNVYLEMPRARICGCTGGCSGGASTV